MATLWNPNTRARLLERAGRLTPDTPPRWGKFDCAGMLAHVNDAIRMGLGEVTPRPKQLAIRFFPLKQLFIYVLPMPKGLPTAPELLVRTAGAALHAEQRALREVLDRFARLAHQTDWPSHPAFGAMSRRDWGVLGYRHAAHHFTQFGV